MTELPSSIRKEVLDLHEASQRAMLSMTAAIQHLERRLAELESCPCRQGGRSA